MNTQKVTIDTIGEIIIQTDQTSVDTYTSKDVKSLVDFISSGNTSGSKYMLQAETTAGEEIGVLDCFIFPSESVAYIHWVSVDQDYQRSGLGTKLVEYMISKLQREAQVETVYTHPVSYGAISLFKNIGFTETNSISSGIQSWYSLSVN